MKLREIEETKIKDFIFYINNLDKVKSPLPKVERRFLVTLYFDLIPYKSRCIHFDELFLKSSLFYDYFCDKKIRESKNEQFTEMLENIFGCYSLFEKAIFSLVLMLLFQNKSFENKFIKQKSNNVGFFYKSSKLIFIPNILQDESYDSLREYSNKVELHTEKNGAWSYKSQVILPSDLQHQNNNNNNAKEKNKQLNKKYSHPQLAIVCYVLGEVLNSAKASELLEKYSLNKNVAKLMSERIIRDNDILSLIKNKPADSKRLNNLIAAKQLVSGMKNQKAIEKIESLISKFKELYEAHY